MEVGYLSILTNITGMTVIAENKLCSCMLYGWLIIAFIVTETHTNTHTHTHTHTQSFSLSLSVSLMY